MKFLFGPWIPLLRHQWSITIIVRPRLSVNIVSIYVRAAVAIAYGFTFDMEKCLISDGKNQKRADFVSNSHNVERESTRYFCLGPSCRPTDAQSLRRELESIPCQTSAPSSRLHSLGMESTLRNGSDNQSTRKKPRESLTNVHFYCVVELDSVETSESRNSLTMRLCDCYNLAAGLLSSSQGETKKGIYSFMILISD